MHVAFEVLLLTGGLQLITAAVAVHSSEEREKIELRVQLRGLMNSAVYLLLVGELLTMTELVCHFLC